VEEVDGHNLEHTNKQLALEDMLHKLFVGEFKGPPSEAVDLLKFLATDEKMLILGVETMNPTKYLDKIDHNTFQRNLQHYQANMSVFHQWINNWKHTRQIEIKKWKSITQLEGEMKGFEETEQKEFQKQIPTCLNCHLNEKQVPAFSWKARRSDSKALKDSVMVVNNFLTLCSVANKPTNDSVFEMFAKSHEAVGSEKPDILAKAMATQPVRLTRQGHEWDRIRDRIAQCCDSGRSASELWSQVHGPSASRATRMAAVAHVGITKHGLRLKGGFIRDWIVAGIEEVPDGVTKTSKEFWGIKNDGFLGRPGINSFFIPQDLDFQFVPSARWFDVMRFKSDVENLGIQVTQVHEDGMLLIVVFDGLEGSPGPFTAEMALPHIAPTMVDIDFDCNNLCLSLDYPKHLCMRTPHLGITIPAIIDRIMKKKFYVCKTRDFQIQTRMEKMKARGWEYLGNKNWIPGTEEGYVRVPITPNSDKWEKIFGMLSTALGDVKIVRMFELQNDNLKTKYNAEKARIVSIDRNQPIEIQAWHGTSNIQDARDGIAQLGMDNRFWSQGMFGTGAYFAADPRKAHNFTKHSANRVNLMFYCHVLLGKVEVLQGEKGDPPVPQGHQRTAPKQGYNSIRGEGHGPFHTVHEYVIFKSEQALPQYQIEYEGGTPQ